MNYFRRQYQVIILNLLFIVIVYPQTKNIQFEHITTENGLSNNSVWSIIQDSMGFMWFGTNRGLNRWDGNKFKIFMHNPNDSNSLSNDSIIKLFLDSCGNIWVGTGNGLNKYNMKTETFTSYFSDKSNDSDKENYIWDIYEDKNKNIWYSTLQGINKLDCKTRKTNTFLPQPDNHELILNPNDIRSICPIDEKHFLLGTGGGLFVFNYEQCTFKKILFDDYIARRWPSIGTICKDSNGIFWLGMRGKNIGLIRYDMKLNKFRIYRPYPNIPDSLSHHVIFKIHKDKQKQMWIGSQNGLNLFDKNAQNFFSYYSASNNKHSLSSSIITALFQDKDNYFWIGTRDAGINKISKRKKIFKTYTHNTEDTSSLSNCEIVSICENKDGDLWIGHFGSGISLLKKNDNKFIRFGYNHFEGMSVSNEWVTDVYEDKMGFIWVGTLGLDRFDPELNRVKRFQNVYNNKNSISKPRVTKIFEDIIGNLWIGFWNGGVDRYDRELNIFQHFRNNPTDTLSIIDSPVLSIYQDSKEVIWIGTRNGLNKLVNLPNGKLGFIRYENDLSNPNSISNNCIYAIFEDSTNRLWFGTEYGLNLFNREEESFIAYTKNEGLPGNYIFAILEDDHCNLWLRTDVGVVRFNPIKNLVRTFDERDGLIDCRATEHGYKAFYKGRSGNFYFGGQRSLTLFHPDSLKDNPNIPKIVLTDFKLNNKSVKIGKNSYLKKAITLSKSIELPYNENILSFEFATLDYTAPPKNEYAHKMEGIDKDWVFTKADNRMAAYTNLDPGEYTFRVRGSNNDGVWNSHGTSLYIIILPPWWATWWFRLITVVTLLVIGYLIYRYRVNQLLALERMRVQIASDLHDDVGSSLTKIAIHSEIIQNTKDKNKVNSSSLKIGSMSREIITSLSDIIWSIDARNDKVGDLIDRMRDYLETVFPTGSITTSFQTKGLLFDNNITQELRQNIYLIFKEAVNNAAKHSEANRVEIKMTNGTGSFRLEIYDNGKGIEFEGKKSHSQGIQNMKLRAERIKGDLQVENKNGTKIILIVKEL